MRRLHLIAAVVVSAFLAAPAAAQTGRVQGIVRDSDGRPIKGVVIKASNPEAIPRLITATTDEKGRFAMLGLRIGMNWSFVAEAPGYLSVEGVARPRTNIGLPMVFTLVRDPDSIPGVLARNVQQQITAANALRDSGRYDDAVAAYQAIQTRNPKLTTIDLVLADLYRNQARQTSDAATRQAFLQKAMAAYEHVLKSGVGAEHARLELAAIAAELNPPTK